MPSPEVMIESKKITATTRKMKFHYFFNESISDTSPLYLESERLLQSEINVIKIIIWVGIWQSFHDGLVMPTSHIMVLGFK